MASRAVPCPAASAGARTRYCAFGHSTGAPRTTYYLHVYWSLGHRGLARVTGGSGPTPGTARTTQRSGGRQRLQGIAGRGPAPAGPTRASWRHAALSDDASRAVAWSRRRCRGRIAGSRRYHRSRSENARGSLSYATEQRTKALLPSRLPGHDALLRTCAAGAVRPRGAQPDAPRRAPGAASTALTWLGL